MKTNRTQNRSRKHDHPRVGQFVGGSGVTKIPLRSVEAVEVARWFGLGAGPRRRERRNTRESAPGIVLREGTITLISGPSGAGKTVLLRRLRELYKEDSRRWIDLEAIALPDEPVVNCFGDQRLEETLALLARVGLGEAWTYLRTPAELSEGQRFRLKLAVALSVVDERRIRDGAALCPGVGGVVIACDEFAAVLDRLTALVVANCLRKVVNETAGLSAVVATSHEDLCGALKPDSIVKCDFGKIEVSDRSSAEE